MAAKPSAPPTTPAGAHLVIDAEALRPLIAAIAAEVLAQVQQEAAALGNRLAYGEAEAAGLLGLEPHQLRDERLRGRIASSRGPRDRVLYSRQDLLDYLGRRRTREGDRDE